MKRARSTSDLVIGMTLAEIFLLLLIVGWYGSRLETEAKGAGPERPYAEIARELEAAKKQLESSLIEAEAQRRRNDQMQRILDWIAKTINFGAPIDSVDTAGKAIERARNEARRGKPSCQSSNVIVDVVSDNDVLKVTLLQSFPGSSGSYNRGLVIGSASELDRFLSFVESYYTQKSGDGQDCRFDYSASWRTDSDYRTVRQTFESYFYPAGIRPLR